MQSDKRDQVDIENLAGCGACHQWACDSPISDGRCVICDRKPDEIIEAHGATDWEGAQLNGVR